MASFKLSLLGSFQVTLDGDVVTAFRSDKVRALLAYLAVEANRPHRRDMLATLLWGKSDEKSARASLRVSLSNLRKALRPLTTGERGEPPLHITRQTARFNDQDPAVWVDVAAFTAHIDATETHPHRDLTHCLVCMRRLAQAVALYRGEFLAGLAPAGSPGFDEWRTVQQETYHQHALAALDTLTAHHLAAGDDEQAQVYARRQLTLTPWREEAHRQLMQALARSGQRAAALAQYQECHRTLADELGVTPSPKTRALYEAIESGTFAEGAWRRTAEEPAPSRPAIPSPPHNLPPQTTPFIGREDELKLLHRRLLDGAYPLVTLAGAGGVGKTRLALAAAEQTVRYFPDGVWFVPLADVTETDTAETLPDAVASAIAAALDFTFTGQQAPTAQLLDYLREKTLLLLLDNFEHLLAAADFILEIVNTALEITVLVTTRERLNFQAEYVMRVEGLPVPASTEEEGAAQFSSVRLFVERAERAPTGFALTDAELPHIIQVCRFVAGLPLGIELAASWISDHTCAEIVQAMQESLDFLATQMRDLPARHRSMRAVFEHTWQLLSQGEKCTLAETAVFRGGFDRDAALAVTSATVHDLAALVDKSLLRRTASGRYERHALLYQFIRSKWEKPETGLAIDAAAVRERHSTFYLAFIAEQETRLYGADARAAVTEIRRERQNVGEAWRRAAERRRLEDLEAAQNALARFYTLTGQSAAGEEAFAVACGQLRAGVEEVGALPGEVRRLLGLLLASQAHLMQQQAKFAEADEVAQAAIEHAQAAGDVTGEAAGYQQRGHALVRQGHFDAARLHLERALTLARDDDLRRLEAASLRALGVRAAEQGHYEEAIAYYKQTLQICRELGDRKEEGQTLNNLGVVSWSLGRDVAARAYFQQALQIFRELGDRQDQGGILVNLGFVAHYQGDYDAALAYYEQALQNCRDVGNRRVEGTVLSALGFISAELGNYAGAQRYYEEGLQLCRTIGDRQGESWRLVYLGLLHHHLADNEAAREHSRQALQIAQEIGDRSIQGYAHTNLGHALSALGDPEKAADAYRQALTLREELGETQLALEARAGLARAALAQGSEGQALAHVEKILDHLRAQEEGLEGTDEPFRIYLTCYQVLHANEDVRAEDVLHEAHQRLQERAANVEDETTRQSFLEDVPVHRRIRREHSKSC